MSLRINSAETVCSSLPVLADVISRSLQELATQLASLVDSAAGPVDTAVLVELVRHLSEVHGALLMIDEQGLAALTQLLRAQLIHCGKDKGLAVAEAARLARSFRSFMDRALDRLLRGQPPLAGELLPCWQQLADPSQSSVATEFHPSALLSLRRIDEPVPVSVPASVNVADIDLRSDFEPALLDFLRAPDEAQRREAARRIADVIAHAYGGISDANERALWWVLHAYLTEFAQAGGETVRANRIVAGSARAMKYRGRSGPALAALAREALFELSQHERSTDEARNIARTFQLDEQFAANESVDRIGMDSDSSGSRFADSVADVLAAIEPEPDKLCDPALWFDLSEAAASGTRSARLAEPLRLVGDRLTNGVAEDQTWLAAVLVCLHDCVKPVSRRVDGISLLADALLETDPVRRWQPLREAAQGSGADRLWREWSSILRTAMTAVEQALDTGDSIQAAHASAIETLTQIAGALQLLGLDATRDAVVDLRSLFEATPAAVMTPDDALAQQWVQLQQSFVLLPWRIPALVSEPEDQAHSETPWPSAGTGDGSADGDSQGDTDAAEDSLNIIFIREAGELLASLRAQLIAPDDEVLLQVAHTLAGCSATVGARAIAALAQAMEEALARGAQWPPELLTETLAVFDSMLDIFAADGQCSVASSLVEQWRQLEAAGAGDQHGSDVVDGFPYSPLILDLHDTADASFDASADLSIDATTDDTEQIILPDALTASDAESMTAASAGALIAAEAATDDTTELLAIFREEASDLLPQLEQAVRVWQRQPDDREPSASLLRVLHTLKGSARMAGQHQLGEDFHRAEAEINILSQQDPAVVTGQLPSLLARVDGWLQSISATSAPSAVLMPTAAAEAVALSGNSPEAAPPLLRVRADRLARVADSGAEIWLGNARVRELMQDQRRSVADLSDDLARLRAQLRELEIEADSRILSHAAQESSADFDPLELDRYTRLHELTRMMTESLTDIINVQRVMARQLENLGSAASSQARDIQRQQTELQALRSQPLQTLEARLAHLLRQASREAGCDAELVIHGGEVEIERGLIDRLMGPLGHLLRNAVVHGIEPPDERERYSKPRTGMVSIAAAVSANELRLTLQDDGRGLDIDRIRARAQAIGLLRGQATPDASALAALIFEPGFSTASEVTALSGRGIGLDAVRVELQALGGHIDVDTEAGQGCRFTIRLPASLASVQVIVATAGRWRIALTASQLQQVLQLDPAQIKQDDDGRQMRWQGDAIRLLHLGAVLGDAPVPVAGARVPVAVLRDGKQVLAVQLDAIEGQREVIVKHPGAQLAQVPGLAGATLLSDGGIALIIDPFRLPAVEADAQPAPPVSAAPVVLVVDDSLTVRRASQRLLERHGYTVVLARDGIEALERLHQQCPAAVLLDIEMPRMDGFELLATLREEERFRSLPVVMITSRIAERHRERAALLGATAYMGKPFEETALLALLSQVCTAQTALA